MHMPEDVSPPITDRAPPDEDWQSSVSLWWARRNPVTSPPALRPFTADVIVIGAGITGLTAALRLKEAGRDVAVLEARTAGSGVTGGTSAHLTEAIDARYHSLESSFGRDGAAVVARSSHAALVHIAERARTFDCAHEIVPGFLYTEAPDELDQLEKEHQAARRAGLNVELTRDVPLPFKTAGGVRFEHQAQIHAGAYATGLLDRCLREGVRLYEHTRVEKVEDGEPCSVHLTNGITLRAKAVFCATHAPLNRVALQTKLSHYRSYVLAYSGLHVPPGLYWDTAEPYHYVRTADGEGSSWLLVGGEDHKTGTESKTQEHLKSLNQWSHQHFGTSVPGFQWSAQVVKPVDGLPYIGRNSGDRHVYVATGFDGNGMTFGTVAALLVSDLIMGRPNEWEPLYHATRIKPWSSAGEFVKENSSYPVHFIGDRLARPDAQSLSDIAPGEGKTVRVGDQRLAVYRDIEHKLHFLSATCPHMGCLVKFNGAERTWDCPCHGSRFTVDGEVLDGPSTKNLEQHHFAPIDVKRSA